MEGFACLMVVLGIAAFLCGPAALIISIVSLNKINALERRQQKQIAIEPPPQAIKMPTVPEAALQAPVEETEIIEEKRPAQPAAAPSAWPLYPQEDKVPTEPVAPVSSIGEVIEEQAKKEIAAQRLSLELFLGTRGLAIAGSIAVLVGVIFGLKYLYENALIGPMGRTLIVAGGGIVALAIGQITRRREYGIVATALAALGFAMLYAADFAAFGFYHIIGTNLAFGLAIAITAAGMFYAVRLNEIIVAFLSLLGGFLSPVLLSSGENRPNAFFGYIAILIGGAMICAAVRKWRSVSRLSFVGTIFMYTAWFSEWYKPAMYGNAIPEQLPVALTWLCVFFAIYLVMPVLYELLKRQAAQTGDVLLIVANAAFCYAYMYQILGPHHREHLALAAVCLGAAHFALMWTVHKRSPQDSALKLSLLGLGLFFVTVAIPLYLKLYAVALAWAGEGAVLALVAVRYRSKITQWASFAALALSVAALVKQLPLHDESFTFIFNSAFGSWCFVAVMYYIAHLFYRWEKGDQSVFSSRFFAQIMFTVSLALLLIAACMEWHSHAQYNLTAAAHATFTRGLIMILAAFMVLYLVPILRPAGIMPYAASCALAMITFAAAMVAIANFHHGPFKFIINTSFGSAVFVAAAFYAAHLFYRHTKNAQIASETAFISQILFCMSLIVLLASAVMEWYGHTQYNLVPTLNQLHERWFAKGGVLICSAFIVLFLFPAFRPAGVLPAISATVLAFVTSIGTLAVFPDFYGGRFTIFANAPFVIGLAPLAALAIAAVLLNRDTAFPKAAKRTACGYGLGIIFFLWILLTEQIYLYWNYPGRASLTAGIDKGQMWISIMWAMYAAAVISVGLWRKLITLRYIGLCFFTIVLIKVFIFDMSTLEKIYRIAGFIVLGLVLIGVSYLYQYLRKTGFFEKSVPSDNDITN